MKYNWLLPRAGAIYWSVGKIKRKGEVFDVETWEFPTQRESSPRRG